MSLIIIKDKKSIKWKYINIVLLIIVNFFNIKSKNEQKYSKWESNVRYQLESNETTNR